MSVAIPGVLARQEQCRASSSVNAAKTKLQTTKEIIMMEEDTRRLRDSVVLYKRPYPSLCPAIFSRYVIRKRFLEFL